MKNTHGLINAYADMIDENHTPFAIRIISSYISEMLERKRIIQ